MMGRLKSDQDHLFHEFHLGTRFLKIIWCGRLPLYGSCPPSKSSSKRKCLTLRPWRRTSFKASIPILICPKKRAVRSVSYEGTQSRNGLADDQRVHLPCALIGVDCFGIGHEASDVVLEEDAVAAEQLARIADGFAAFDRAERLRERRMLVAHHTFVLKLRKTQHHRLGGCDVAKHADQQILDELESADRPPELRPLRRIAERMLVGSHLAAYGEPRHAGARHPENLGGVLERVCVLQAVGLGNTAVTHG